MTRWLVGIKNVTASNVDTQYEKFINNETAGTFETVGGIMLTHELNNFTMLEAVKWYPQLKASFQASFQVWRTSLFRLDFRC
jgi:hypothetical protein